MSVRVEPVSPATEPAALEYLARAPFVNVFITYLILYDRAASRSRKVLLALEGGAVRGVASYGSQFAIASDTEAIAAFAERAKRHHGERMIVGPRETVRTFWNLVASWHARPRIVRERQLVMAIDRRRLRRNDRAVEVRRARADEWGAVADASAQTIEQELAYDPRRTSADFGAHVRQAIDRKLWWVGLSEGRICFFCSVGPWCKQTTQLQGIWAPPQSRGQGLATASLAAICDRLLDTSPTLSLYVNDFNEPAIALYRRVGFEYAADFQTILF